MALGGAVALAELGGHLPRPPSLNALITTAADQIDQPRPLSCEPFLLAREPHQVAHALPSHRSSLSELGACRRNERRGARNNRPFPLIAEVHVSSSSHAGVSQTTCGCG